MTSEEFKKLELLERLKVQFLQIDIPTANSLLEHAKSLGEENLFYSAFAGAISTERTAKEKNIYTQYFNDLNAKAYTKQKGQSEGGQKSHRTRNKPKSNPEETNLDI